MQSCSGQIRMAEFDRTRAPPSHTVTHNQDLSLISLCNDHPSNAYTRCEPSHRLYLRVRSSVSHLWLTVIVANQISFGISHPRTTRRDPHPPIYPPRFTERALLLREVNCV